MKIIEITENYQKNNFKILFEKNVPLNPQLWGKAKALAKKKFDVYPSAYANAWAAKKYREWGGKWKKMKIKKNLKKTL